MRSLLLAATYSAVNKPERPTPVRPTDERR